MLEKRKKIKIPNVVKWATCSACWASSSAVCAITSYKSWNIKYVQWKKNRQPFAHINSHTSFRHSGRMASLLKRNSWLGSACIRGVVEISSWLMLPRTRSDGVEVLRTREGVRILFYIRIYNGGKGWIFIYKNIIWPKNCLRNHQLLILSTYKNTTSVLTLHGGFSPFQRSVRWKRFVKFFRWEVRSPLNSSSSSCCCDSKIGLFRSEWLISMVCRRRRSKWSSALFIWQTDVIKFGNM